MSSLMAVRADAVREALDNFPVLLLDLDAGRALHILGIGRLQFRRRARLLAEWRGLCMALWRSFPEHAEAMFRQFRESFGPWSVPRPTGRCWPSGAMRTFVPCPVFWPLSFSRTRPAHRPWPCA